MSTDKNKSEAGTATSKFSLVRLISQFLKLGDVGKLDSFFTRVVKNLNKEVSAHKKNLENLKFNHEQSMDALKDELEDAETALSEAYLNVDVESIGTNEQQNSFQDVYISRIDTHEQKVSRIEATIKRTEDSYKESVKGIEDQIASLTKRIKKISAE